MLDRVRLPRLPLPVAAACLVAVIAGCTTGTPTPTASFDALPTGLVGPVAPTTGPSALRYVAIGDSYTFGDGVQQADRWPNQLLRILRPDLDLELTANLAGRTTASRQVIEDQLTTLLGLDPQLVSIQVGVNDAISGTSAAAYRTNMAAILDTVLTTVPRDRVFVMTTPDYTLTPAGPEYGDAAARSLRIRELNGVLQEVADARGIAIVDITPIADRVQLDPTLVAPDQLHPSGKQYAGWADLAAGTVLRLFREVADASPSTSPTPTDRSVPRASSSP